VANKKVIKCHNKEVHRTASGTGSILLIIDKGALYMHCKERSCKRWTKVQISFPGITLDFTKAAVVQTLMPEGYHFDVSDAPVVVGGQNE